MQSQYTLPPLRLYCICMVLHDVASMAIVLICNTSNVAAMGTCRSSHNVICLLAGLTGSLKKHSLVYLQHLVFMDV